MTLNLLFDHFDQLITRPEDIPRLNETILQLAVQGKLLPQDPADEPASELLKRIRAEKDRLLLTGQIHRDKHLQPVDKDEIPYELPESWRWTRLGEIVTLKSGTTIGQQYELEDGDLIYLKVGDMNLMGNEYQITTSTRFVNYSKKIVDKLIPVNSIIFPKRGGAISTNKKRIIVKQILADSNLMAMNCPSDLLLEYLYYWFLSIDLWALNSGTSVPQINNKDIEPILFALPPLAEQERIVAKVESLLAQTRALVAELAAAEMERARLNRAGLHHLLAAPTPTDFTARWHFVASHFDGVTTDPASVDELKQIILQLAVQGKLVPQDPADEPASHALYRILLRRQQSSELEAIIEDKSLPEVNTTEFQLPTPNGLPILPVEWLWATVEQIAERIVDCLHSTPKFQTTGYHCIDTNCIEPAQVIFEKIRYVDEATFHERNRRMKPRENDVLFSREGARLGIAVRAPADLEFCLGQRMMAFRLSECADATFFELVLNSLIFRSQYIEKITGSASPHLNIGDIRKFFIPLPPLAEQKRIVAKVECMLKLCDELKASLVGGEVARARLLESVLYRAVNGVSVS